MEMRLSIAIVYAAVGLGVPACNAPTPAPQQGLALTHQWSVKAGTSLFVQVSLGATPDAAADAMMSTMPTVIHQLGERCRSNAAAATPGVFTLSFALEGGVATNPTSEPASALADCVIGAMPAVMKEHAAALATVPPASVVLHLEHAPVAG
ncbi:MAG: hypothetical protein JNK45_33310 [Myxococcales bacterium]|nr:hypothetical protein [Myxococcales bacterium]